MTIKNTRLLVRYLIAPILVLTLSLPTFTSAQGEPVVRFDPSAGDVAVGETVTIDIVVEGVTDLYGVEVHFSFDPAIVEVVDADGGTAGVQITMGSFLTPDFVAVNEVDTATGVVDLAYSAMHPTQPVSGNGVLATVTFRGVSAGTVPLDFVSVLLAGADAMPIDANLQNGQVVVSGGQSGTATSEPTATPTSTTMPSATATSTPEPTETPTSDVALLTFGTPTLYVDVGETTDVELRVTGATDLYGVEVHLTHGSGVDATAIQAGTCLDDVIAQAAVDGNKVDYASSLTAPSEPFDGACGLATITIRGLVEGAYSLTFDSALLSGPNGEALDVTTQDLAIVVSAAAETPTATPTATPTPTGTPGPTPAPGYNCSNVLGYHVVRRGETLYAIGRAYGVYPYAIASCNRIINPSLIYPNTRFSIPNFPWVPVPPGHTAQRQFGGGAVVPSCRAYHTVRPGENLFRISLFYGVGMWTIAEANGILNLHYVQAGRTLCIP